MKWLAHSRGQSESKNSNPGSDVYLDFRRFRKTDLFDRVRFALPHILDYVYFLSEIYMG